MVEPIPMRPLLTIEAMDEAEELGDYEAALSLPLPLNPSIELLIKARRPNRNQRYPESPRVARDTLAAKMTPAQIAEAQQLAREWKPKSEQR